VRSSSGSIVMKGDTSIRMPSADPIEVVRALNAYWAVRPFALVRELLLASEDWDDAVRRFEEAGLRADPIDPDVEVVLDVDLIPEGAAWIGQRGRDQWISFWKWWFEAWDDLQIDDSDYEQIGDHVVVEMHVTATPRGSTESIETPVVQLFKLREGLICLYGVYPNRDDALAAIMVEQP
jgi:hypothetical protein